MTYGVQGSVAPELLVPYWIDENGRARPPVTLKELGSRPRILFFYQHWCQGCHSHGFPTLLELIERTTADDVGFSVIQTVFEGFEANTPYELIYDQNRYGLRIPFGHDTVSPDGHYPITMVNYRTGGTPWFVAIDPLGTVIENGFSVDVNSLLSILGRQP